MILIHKANIINEGKEFTGSVLLEGELIKSIYKAEVPEHVLNKAEIVDASGLWLMPGAIDDQVHFRTPGLTHKGDIESESKAAIAGGITSFMDMPNTNPQTTGIEELERKFELAETMAFANYSFYLGATNNNLMELKKVSSRTLCGIKVFMGSSTGNMLVDSKRALQSIFAEVDMLIATHCEKEEIIRANIDKYNKRYPEGIPLNAHPLVRSAEACYQSSAEAVELADKYDANLHILHISTERELSLFDIKPLEEKKITAEVCVHHLWFSDEDYARYGTKIKWNPAVKTKQDRKALLDGLNSGKLDIVATDHAPHTLDEKKGGFQAASGGPLVQHSLLMMLELAKQGKISKELVVEKMAHAPALRYQIDKRGYIREGYYADLVLVNPNEAQTISKDNILYHCKWSPLEGETLSSKIERTYLNGKLAYKDGEIFGVKGERLSFNR